MTGGAGGILGRTKSAAFCSLVLFCSCTSRPAPAPGIAIVDVTIVDVRDGTLTPGATVLITGERITEIGPAASVRAPKRARRIDGRGKFLIPGLWDMHARSDGDLTALYTMVSLGITGVRDIGSDPAKLDDARRQIDARLVAGPRVFTGVEIPERDARFVPPGRSLHSALDGMVSRGATPLQALQAATLNPVAFLGLRGSLGVIEPGRAADVVMLDSNPLDDIRNTRRVSAVIARGLLVSERTFP